jgi:hypothetical protein
MNQGSNPPSGQSGGKGRRRRRRGPVSHTAPQQNAQQHRHGPPKRHGRKHGQRPAGQAQTGGGIYTAPMDHSYRNAQGNNNGNLKHGRGRGAQNFGKQFMPADPEPLPMASEEQPTRIFAFVDDLFFLAKIQETARKMNVKVEFVKTEKDLTERMGENGNDKPSLIIFDLNNAAAKPLSTIPKLKSRLKKQTNIIGFLSHVQGELKLKAQEAGCDMVVPRSAFSQNLAQILRRHGAPEELHEPQPGHPGL